jgi:DnaJ-class molecular chaperone
MQRILGNRVNTCVLGRAVNPDDLLDLPSFTKNCKICKGSGMVSLMKQVGLAIKHTMDICPECQKHYENEYQKNKKD